MSAANIPPFSNMTPNAKVLSGSTGAKLYKNTTDKKWVIKKSEKGEGGFPQVQSESVANDIYQALGIPVPRHFLDIPNQALILEYIDGKSLADATPAERTKAKKELQKGFIVDALLANWDVIGLLEDNILLPADGSSAVRIDNGGSLTFRAQGGPKYFGKTVSEIDKMRNPSIAPRAAAIFGDLTDTDINEQIKTIIVPNYELILSFTPKELKEIMRGRMDYLIGKMVWVNEEPFKNTVEETSTPEYIPEVQKALIKFFRSGWLKNFKNENKGAGNSDERLLAFLNKTLKDNHAIISGGFILKAIGTFVDEKSVDIDIYVPTAYTAVFRGIMSKLFDETSHVTHFASPTGFFNKNGIVSVTKYKREIDADHYAEMDIVEVKGDRTPKDVVQNFDLTFCENWYDGENVYMTYPEHVKTKKGFLENHYLKLLFEGSQVLINRMKKYIRRGFRVSIHNPVTKKDKNVTKNILTNTFFQKITDNANTENTIVAAVKADTDAVKAEVDAVKAKAAADALKAEADALKAEAAALKAVKAVKASPLPESHQNFYNHMTKGKTLAQKEALKKYVKAKHEDADEPTIKGLLNAYLGVTPASKTPLSAIFGVTNAEAYKEAKLVYDKAKSAYDEALSVKSNNHKSYDIILLQRDLKKIMNTKKAAMNTIQEEFNSHTIPISAPSPTNKTILSQISNTLVKPTIYSNIQIHTKVESAVNANTNANTAEKNAKAKAKENANWKDYIAKKNAKGERINLNEFFSEHPEYKISYNTPLKPTENSNNITKLSLIPNTPASNFSSNISRLTLVDIKAIENYTGNGYDTVNRFLYTNLRCHPDKTSVIYKWIQDKFPLNNEESVIDYNNRVIYYYFVNLFNALGKIKGITDKPVKVYRGTRTWYLEENTDRFYYINSFSSTSITSSVALSFGSSYIYSNSTYEQKIYVFYLHPNCSFLDVEQISFHKRENEILLNPYHRYKFVKQTESADGKIIYKHLVVLPIDIDIPTTYDTFMPWKNRIVDKTIILKNGKAVPPPVPLPAVPVSPSVSLPVPSSVPSPVPLPALETAAITKGGRVISTVPGMLRHRTLKNTKVRGKTIKNRTLEKGRARTNKKLNSRQTPKKAKQNIRRRTLKMESDKVNTSKKLLLSEAPKKNVVDENTIRRFTDPLPSFPGKVPTKAEMEVIEKMMAFFKNDKE